MATDSWHLLVQFLISPATLLFHLIGVPSSVEFLLTGKLFTLMTRYLNQNPNIQEQENSPAAMAIELRLELRCYERVFQLVRS